MIIISIKQKNQSQYVNKEILFINNTPIKIN
ncbi:hypothetical protein ACSSV5_001857 [Psychroflexus sp. MBR-150]|jgi:hypothetical protein